MRYEAVKLTQFNHWIVMIDDGPQCLSNLHDEVTAKRIARALNRDELYDEMVKCIKAASEFQCPCDILGMPWHQHFKSCPVPPAKTLLAKIEALEKGGGR